MRVELAGGEEVRGDLLVGADGLRSATRKLLMGEREARFTDVVVWRGLIPREKVPSRYDAKIMAWFGPRRHVLLYPLRHDGHPEQRLQPERVRPRHRGAPRVLDGVR